MDRQVDNSDLDFSLNIKRYVRYKPGIITLGSYSAVLAICVAFRFFSGFCAVSPITEMLLKPQSFPPISLIWFSALLINDPDEFVGGLCTLGRILMPTLVVLYCTVLCAYSYINRFYIDMIIHGAGILIEISLLLSQETAIGMLFRPYKERPVEEITAEREMKIQQFHVHSTLPAKSIP